MYKKYDSVELNLSQEDLDELKELIKDNTERLSDSKEDDVFRSRNTKMLHTLETYGHADRETYIFKNEFKKLFWIMYEEAIYFKYDSLKLCKMVDDCFELIDEYKKLVKECENYEFPMNEEDLNAIRGVFKIHSMELLEIISMEGEDLDEIEAKKIEANKSEILQNITKQLKADSNSVLISKEDFFGMFMVVADCYMYAAKKFKEFVECLIFEKGETESDENPSDYI